MAALMYMYRDTAVGGGERWNRTDAGRGAETRGGKVHKCADSRSSERLIGKALPQHTPLAPRTTGRSR